MKRYRKWSLAVLTMTLGLLALLVSLNFAVDPLQFYRKAWYEASFSTQQRYQNPGLAKHYDYDTIIVGTSMTENFLSSYVNARLGGKTLKLSMSGATSKEQYMIAKLAIDTGKVKRVIWGVDYFALRGEPDRVRDEFGPFPHYFYDRNPFNDIKYLLNLDTTADTVKALQAALGIIKPDNTDLERLNTWTQYTFSKKIVLAEWNKVMSGGSFVPSEYEFDNIKQNLNENIIPLIQQNKEIQFILYYPPYSILQHRFFYEKSPALFENELATKRYLYEQVGSLPNVRIYDFQQDEEITFNLDNYKDLAHHSAKINEYIIDSIAAGTHRVDGNNLAETMEELRRQVESVQVNKL
jgi:hypothetical protein